MASGGCHRKLASGKWREAALGTFSETQNALAPWRVNEPYDGCIGGVIFLIAPTLGYF